MAISTQDWLERYAAELHISAPTAEETNDLLALAGIAAHASERTAAPVSCWLAARTGLAPDRALELARRLADRLAASPEPAAPPEPAGESREAGKGREAGGSAGHDATSRSAPE